MTAFAAEPRPSRRQLLDRAGEDNDQTPTIRRRFAPGRDLLRLAISARDDKLAAVKGYTDGHREDLDRDELLARALCEIDELGANPGGERAWLWCEERRGSVELMAALAGWDGTLLRRAAICDHLDERHQVAAELLREASQISRPASTDGYRAARSEQSGVRRRIGAGTLRLLR